MKTDVNGCSACPTGTENYEEFTPFWERNAKPVIQYDYRHTNGKLFSTVAPTLEKCLERRNKWMEENNYA